MTPYTPAPVTFGMSSFFTGCEHEIPTIGRNANASGKLRDGLSWAWMFSGFIAVATTRVQCTGGKEIEQ